MKISINTFAGIIIIVVGLMLNIGVVIYHQEIVNARHFHSDAIYNIEASGFHEDVIASEVEKAVEQGYTLEVSPIKNHEDKTDMKVILKFESNIPILGIDKQNTLEGYAR